MRSVSACLALLLAACGSSTSTPDASHADAQSADAGPQPQGDVPHHDIAVNEVSPQNGVDWIEFVNRGAVTVDLSGWFVTNAADRLDHYYEFPAGTTLAAGAYLIVYADHAAPVAGEHHAPFKLGAADGAFVLSHDGLIVDSVLWISNGLGAGETFQRIPDHEGVFWPAPPTQAAANPAVLP